MHKLRSRWTGTLIAIAGFLNGCGCSGPHARADTGSWGIVSDDDSSGDEQVRRSRPRRRDPRYASIIERVIQMPTDSALRSRTQERGLNVVNVMWEDTGRYLGSSVGPNISDLTLQVREPMGNGDFRTHLLPVIRYPNFTDRTADIAADKIWVRVGNHNRRGSLRAVPLTEVLENLKDYVSDPDSLRGSGDFLAERDTHFLVSAQHVFVPLAEDGKAEFTPVLYNYQSSHGNPAVLTLLITRQGMSAQVIENHNGDQSYQQWGQQLFYNNKGHRTVFTAERRSAVADRIDRGEAEEQDEGALEEGADMMMVVQIPLRHREMRRSLGYYGGDADDSPAPAMEAAPAAPGSQAMRGREGGRSDVEQAVLGHGENLGRYHEGRGLRLVRDERFPVRITVQFYKATSNGVVSNADLREVEEAIDRVYADADYVGSLVVPRGHRHRPTEWTGRHHRPYRNDDYEYEEEFESVPYVPYVTQ